MQLSSPEDKLRLVCGHVDRCWRDGAAVAVRVASQDEAEQLDRMMWTFRDISFIPHVRLSEAQEPLIEQVIIYAAGEAVGEADVLIEAAGGEPGEHFQTFDRLLDFAEVYDDALKEASRRRYKAYQQAGYRMRYIKGRAGRTG